MDLTPMLLRVLFPSTILVDKLVMNIASIFVHLPSLFVAFSNLIID